jgi:small subunit ribosomal protein S2
MVGKKAEAEENVEETKIEELKEETTTKVETSKPKKAEAGEPQEKKIKEESPQVSEEEAPEDDEDDENLSPLSKEVQEYISSTEGKKLLIEPEEYLKHGTHIGLTYRTGNMNKFIYKVRQDRLSIFSLNKIDERIRLAAKMLACYDKEDILIVGSRAYARRPVRIFAETTGVRFISGRFRPGSFTNPLEKNFKEPKIVFVADPIADRQAVREAAKVGISVIGVCDSNALTRNLDLIIPLNNKGKQSVALMFYLLTKQYLIEKGELKEGQEMEISIDDFTSQIQPTKKVEAIIKSKRKDTRYRS